MNKTAKPRTVFLDYEAPPGFHCEYLWDPKNNVFYEKHVLDEAPEVIAAKVTAELQAEEDAAAEHRAENPQLYLEEENPATPEAPEPEISPEDPLALLRKTVPIVIGRAAIEALAAESIPFVWGSVVVEGTINLFAGGPSSGKSTLLFLLLAARSSLDERPLEFLTFPVAPATPERYIVLIEGEHGERSTARKLLRSYALLGLEPDGLDRVVVIARKAVTVGSPAWNRIKKLSRDGYVSDVFLDTLARVSPLDVEANDEKGQIAVFEEITKLIEDAPKQPTVWIAAHTRKTPAALKDGKRKELDLEDVAGSAQRSGQCDTVVGVEGRTNETRTIRFLKLREEPDIYPEPIDYLITREGIEIKTGPAGSASDDFDVSDEAVSALFGTGLAGKIATHMAGNPDQAFSFGALRRVGGSGANGMANPDSLRKVMQSFVKSGRVTDLGNGSFQWSKPDLE